MTGERSLAEIAKDGERLASLKALRDVLAMSIAEAEPQSMAALARQFQSVLDEIETIENKKGRPGKVTPRDEIAARRRRRAEETRKAKKAAGE